MTQKLLIAAMVLALFGCSKNQAELEEVQKDNAKKAFSDSVSDFNINVYYENSATPYLGTLGTTGNNTWDMTTQSFSDLFQSHANRSINVPSTLGQMSAFEDQNHSTWYPQELIALGKKYAPEFSSGSQINISVFFLRGTYSTDTSATGVQITGYPFAFIFKDAIVSAGGSATVQRYIEQAVVIHEVGHAVGLVNNGVPAASKHEDNFHQGHHDNRNCAMYWEVEDKRKVAASISNMISANRLSLFSTQSLNDGRGYHP